MTTDALVEIADRLYAEPLSDFTAARDAAARATTTGEDADKALAARIKSLKTPSVAAWAINLLVRREADQIDQALALGDSLRAAAESMSADDLRALTRQRRQLTHALTATARDLAREHDVRLTGPVADQVEGMLTAAMLDPVAARVVRSGLVLTAFTSTGVSELDVAAVCAVPAALGDDVGHRATRTDRPAPSLRLVPEDDRVRRESAQEQVDEARRTVEESRIELAEVDETVATLRARRLQLQGEIDELRRRLATLEDDVDGVDEDLEEAEGAREDASVVLQEAESALASAQRALDDLSPASRRRR
jgi:septal ring factor EnvC (AmiA/AmiB activator)